MSRRRQPDVLWPHTDDVYVRTRIKRIIMAQVNYYPEDVLIEKMQEGQYGWLDYVNHHSREWQEEYARYCASMGVCINEHSAEAFVYQKDMELEEAMLRGDA